MLTVIGLLALAWFAPALIGHSPLLNHLIRRATVDFRGSVSVGGASLGWLSPVVLHDVELRDAVGGSLVSVPRVEVNRTLLQLLTQRTDLGEIDCRDADLRIACTESSTNWEEALAHWLESAESESCQIALQLTMHQARLLVYDAESEKEWTVRPLDLNLHLPDGRPDPVRLTLRGEVEGGGRLETAITVRKPADATVTAPPDGEFTAQVDGLPLVLLAPVLRRFESAARLNGRITGKVEGQWEGVSGGSRKGRIETALALSEFDLAGPWVGSEQLRLDRLDLPIRATLDDSRIQLERAELHCDLGRATLAGTFDLKDGLPAALARPGYGLTAEVDFAQLANRLPKLARLQKDTQLTAGRLSFNVVSRSDKGGGLWEGRLDTSDLRGVSQGKAVSWPAPVAVAFIVRQAGTALPVVDKLWCQSDFLKLEGTGSLDGGAVRADLDLNRLAGHLARFVDLGGTQLSGQLATRSTVQREKTGRFHVRTETDLRNLELAGIKAGSVNGPIDWWPVADHAGVIGDLTGREIVFGPPTAPVWREAQVQLTGRGQYYFLRDGIRFESLRLDNGQLACEAAGRLEGLSGSRYLTLAGKLHYDWDKLEPHLRPYLGPGVKVTGRDARPFKFEGALAAVATGRPLLTWTGDAGLGWKAIQAYGGQVGPAELQTQLRNGRLTLAPIDATVNEGRFHLEASARLEPGPAEVTLAPGQLVDRARLTPAVCASALGYAIPALARSTEVEGLVSVRLSGGRIPLDLPQRSEVAGTFTLHAARISASPLLRELSVLLRGPGEVKLAREAVVPFRLVDGRVHHQNLELAFPDVTIRTQGSVGLDGTLDLVAELPIPPKWVGSKPLGAALAKQILRLPIRGTLERPKLDEKALRDALAQVARAAAGSVLQREVENQLQKLLRPGK